MKKPRPLTAKQRLFIDWYLRTWNATESARRCRHSWHTLGHTRKYRVAANTPQHGDMVEHGVSPQAQTNLLNCHFPNRRLSKMTCLNSNTGDVLKANKPANYTKRRDLALAKIIKVVKQGGPDTMKATRFRYLPAMEAQP